MNDILVTMQEDLARALKKPAGSQRWAMLLDLRKCVGCHACTVACISENKLPPKLWYRPVYEYERGTYPKVSRTWIPRPCMQCDKPPCVPVCPVKGKATWKETRGLAAGLVPINYQECIGCGKCVPACPYKARTMDDGSFHTDATPARQRYESMPAFEYGNKLSRTDGKDPEGKARKCHFCFHRMKEGLLPQCVTTCIGRVNYFGDESDPQSLIAQVKKGAKVQILKAKKGTGPRVYYIANEKLEVLYG